MQLVRRKGGVAVQESGEYIGSGVSLPDWERLPDIGLYMDQMITLMERTFKGVLPDGEITRSMVNNYVKSGLLPRPVGKKYDRDHLARLMMICLLKQALSMEHIAQILDMVCAQGTQIGYRRFCLEVDALKRQCSEEQMVMPETDRSFRARAVRAGATAALCAIHTRHLMGKIKLEEN